jgi:hypothetical protein
VERALVASSKETVGISGANCCDLDNKGKGYNHAAPEQKHRNTVKKFQKEAIEE